MNDRFGTFQRKITRQAGQNVTKSGVLGRQKFCNPLVGLEKSMYILLGWCTYPF